MAVQHLVVENKVLQGPSFNSHDHRALDRIQWGQYPLGPGIEADGAGRAIPDANPAPQAHVRIDGGRATVAISRSLLDRPHGAHVDAVAATRATRGIDARDEIGVDRAQQAETSDGQHGLAATSAAVTDEIDAPAHVFTELDQVVALSLLQQIDALRRIDTPGMPVSYQGGGGRAECHANVFRGAAIPLHVRHLVRQ